MRRFFPLLALAALSVFSLSANAFSQAELAAFQALSPAQQQALLKQVGGGAPVGGVRPLEQPNVVEPVADLEPLRGAEDSDELRHYGYDLFKGTPTTFAPATDVPVPADYVVGPGDVISVQEYGKDSNNYELQINRNGVVALPGVGEVNAVGMSFSELKRTIRNKIERQKIGVTASITMGQLRSIRVFVLGDARRPGSYTVSALTTMTNALFVSGGIKEIGSLRNIQLKRGGKVVSSMDLYDLLMRGDTSADVRLQPGDVLFVPPRGETVSVDGEVLRPAIYELSNERTVAQVLRLAGGLTSNAWRDKATIERVERSGERSLLAVSLRATPTETLIRDGDKLTVQSTLDNVDGAITVHGYAERLGRFAAKKGMRLTDLIPNADALKVGADLDFALLKRRDKATGEISVQYLHPGLAFLNQTSAHNTALLAGDELYFFPSSETADLVLEKEQEKAEKNERPFVRKTTRAADNEVELADEEGADDVEQQLERDKVALGLEQTDDAAERDESSRSAVIEKLVGELIAQANTVKLANVAKITGAVRFPGRYPLDMRGTRVTDLLRAGGGLEEYAYLLEAEITRYAVVEKAGKQHQEAVHIAVNLKDAFNGDPKANIMLYPRDVITVRYVPAWDQQYEVKIAGEVQFPGTYPVKRNETIVDLIQRAGGLTPNAYPRGAALIREQLIAKEQAQAERLSRRLESDLAALSLESLATDGDKTQAFLAAQGLLEELKQYKPTGRLVIDLPKMMSGGLKPITLEGNDELIIPPEPTEVTVVGEVQFPTSHLFDGDLSRKDYLRNSGGITERADKRRIFVVKANGSVVSGRVKIEPGDTIVVPLDSDRVRPLTLWTNITQIIYQLGLAAAGFKAVGAF